jgi:hypothetical protein
MPSFSFSIRPGFKRFLVSTPLAIDESTGARTWAGDPDRDYKVPYGSYHQLYRIDGRLVAVRISYIVNALLRGWCSELHIIKVGLVRPSAH